MGMGRFSATDWDTFTSTTTAGKSTAAVFSRHGLHKDFDPNGITLRESRDSDLNPASTAIIVGLDVTGSMGMIADQIARVGLKTLFEEIYSRKPVSDPHIMFMGIGDVDCDRAPLQVSQFEADIKIADQLTDLYLEHGGGGNWCESYTLPWHFAATKTSIDCFEKRGKKGFLFTVGDEEPPPEITTEHLRKIGLAGQHDLTARDVLTMVSRMYHVFHVMVEQGSHYKSHPDKTKQKWVELLGQRAIPLSDYTKLSEVIVSAIQVVEGADADTVAKSWTGDTAVVVSHAVNALTKAPTGSTGLVTL